MSKGLTMLKKTKLTVAFVLLFFWMAYSQVKQAARYAGRSSADILWDTYGVPHVYANDIASMYYAFGWSQMNNHANLLLKLYGQARGRAAEYWGEQYVDLDQKIKTFNIPAIGMRQYEQQKPVFKPYLDAFVKGVNDYASANPKSIDDANRPVLPITGADVLSHAARVLYLEFLAGDDIERIARQLQKGSNAIAVAPSRSAARNAMLLANPHLPWGDFFTFFEAHLNAPGFSAYGATLVGFPVLAIAFNNHLGWTHTVNTIDASDRYELTLQDDGYLLDGKKEKFEEQKAAIKIKTKDGAYEERTLLIRHSKHGVIAGEKIGKAYAVRIAGIENNNLMYQYHLMALASNRRQFEAALQLMQLPMFNVIYADDAGNIAYNFAGNVPIRDSGDWKFWHSNIDGSKSKYIWQKVHSYNDLPKLVNPATGFIQNANDPPWTCTYPEILNPADYPPYMSPIEMDLRPQRAVLMVKNNPSVSFEDLVNDKFNTGMEAAKRLVPGLLQAVKRYPDSIATLAASVLGNWDYTTDSASGGAVLFIQWTERMPGNPFETAWDPKRPIETPSGLKNPRFAVSALDSAANELTRLTGRMNIPYGEVFRFRSGHFDYAGNGGPGDFGIFRTIYYQPDADKKFRAVAGDSYVAITEFGKKVKAKVLLSYSNASQKNSKHTDDQLLLLSQKKLRDAWLTKEEVRQHLEKAEKLMMK
jgi:acyl-homoserine-lactone acylase